MPGATWLRARLWWNWVAYELLEVSASLCKKAAEGALDKSTSRLGKNLAAREEGIFSQW